jgi:hypothetical protein
MMTTILDVIDNFFAFRRNVDISSMPGSEPKSFDEGVRR